MQMILKGDPTPFKAIHELNTRSCDLEFGKVFGLRVGTDELGWFQKCRAGTRSKLFLSAVWCGVGMGVGVQVMRRRNVRFSLSDVARAVINLKRYNVRCVEEEDRRGPNSPCVSTPLQEDEPSRSFRVPLRLRDGWLRDQH